ncbi:MAG: SOS response-associated peptidase [Flavobacteriales bacterium]
MCFQLSLEFDAGLARKNQRVIRNWDDWQNSRRIFLTNAFTKPMLPVFTVEDPLTPQEMRWGLIPPWATKDPDGFLKKASTYNAISVGPEGETFYDKPSFRNAAKKEQRCLIPATGFFEFHHLGKQTFPHYIHLKSRALFFMAGIYDNGTFSILTTEANPLMAFVHNSKKRMPVILPQELEQTWLTAGLTKEDVLAMCKPYPVDDMEAWTVSRLITSRSEDPDQEAVRQKVDYPELGIAQSFW